MPLVELPHSRKQVTKAGKTLRGWWQSPTLADAAVLDAIDVVSEFRKAHAYPLSMVAANLRYYVKTHCPAHILIGQRLKRLPTIIDKLARSPAMALVTMEDIGGCRAVVNTEAEIRAIVAHLKKRWKGIVRERDYISSPKPDSGYRAYHLVVEKAGRRIEIQLRTGPQHDWAEYVEATDRANPGLKLKSGKASAEVMEYFRLGANLTELLERNQLPDRDTMDRFQHLHDTVGTPLREGTYGSRT